SLPYRKLRIFAVYRSPSSPPSAFTSFLDFITPLMTSQFPCILIGDFNYPQVDWISMTSSTISDLIDFACDHYLKQFVRFPTRLQNFLDLVFCNFDIISNISPSVPLSDHLSLVFDLRIPSPPLHSPTPSRLYKYADWLSINSVILSHDWTVAMSALDANCAYEYYVQFINDLLDYYVPLSKPSLLSRYPRNLKILYGKCKNLVRNAPNSLACLRMTDRFNAALNNYHCFMECRIVASSNPKAFYNLCSDRLKAPKATPSGLVDSSGNVLITNDEKCIAFSSFFSSAFSVPQHSPLPLPSPKFTFDIPTVSHLDILCALRSVLPKINVSPDRIPSIVLTKCKYSLLTPLSIIFNKSLLTSQYFINNVPLVPPPDKKMFVKDLGVLFTPTLSFSDHINKFISKARLERRRFVIDIMFLHSVIHRRCLLDTSPLLVIAPIPRSLQNSHNLRILLPFIPTHCRTTVVSRTIATWNSLPESAIFLHPESFRNFICSQPPSFFPQSIIKAWLDL
ncbi:hypothetical protein PMAYCL1PPCAC_26767, partial [Pristionchus mayeri]